MLRINRQSNLFREVSAETIRGLFERRLGEPVLWEAVLLEGGLFNTTYLVEYGDPHKKAVLRLGPVNRHLLMGFENNLMQAEVYAYSLCRKIGVPCSHVLACDTSKQLIDRDFMIVKYIPSVVMSKVNLTEAQRKHLHFQMGVQLARLHQVTGGSFGFLSRIREGKLFPNWSSALLFEVEDITGRFVRLGGLRRDEAEAVRETFSQSRELLDEVQTPRLLHADLWEGNVLLSPDTLEIAAVIDSDRAVFGDPDLEFSPAWMEKPELLAGYRSLIKEVCPANSGRRRLYQMFFSLLESYVGYGEYNDGELYQTRKETLLQLLAAPSRL